MYVSCVSETSLRVWCLPFLKITQFAQGLDIELVVDLGLESVVDCSVF